jgi:hypothetical protein
MMPLSLRQARQQLAATTLALQERGKNCTAAAERLPGRLQPEQEEAPKANSRLLWLLQPAKPLRQTVRQARPLGWARHSDQALGCD